MRKFSVFVLLSLLSLTCVAQSGPFGFERGMTKSQIIELVGQKNVDPSTLKGEVLRVKTAPKPSSAFAGYMLMVSPKDGLLRVAAVGPNLNTSDDGLQLRAAYQAVLQGLTHDFGPPSSTTDECNGPGILCKRNDNWMMTLYGKQRKLGSTWLPTVPTQTMRQAGVHVITLQVNASSMNSGFISCDFELEGYDHYAKGKEETPSPAEQKEKAPKE
ncbi:MAG: hypothetical protein ACXVZX_04640 [Terriglobales bacterium]